MWILSFNEFEIVWLFLGYLSANFSIFINIYLCLLMLFLFCRCWCGTHGQRNPRWSRKRLCGLRDWAQTLLWRSEEHTPTCTHRHAHTQSHTQSHTHTQYPVKAEAKSSSVIGLWVRSCRWNCTALKCSHEHVGADVHVMYEHVKVLTQQEDNGVLFGELIVFAWLRFKFFFTPWCCCHVYKTPTPIAVKSCLLTDVCRSELIN